MVNATELATAIAGVSAFGPIQADAFWLMICGFLVFFMQCGFALLEAGTVRAKNTKNILLKNLLDACMGALTWYFIGYGFAYDACSGKTTPICAGKTNAFIGATHYHFTIGDIAAPTEGSDGNDWMSWYFQFAFAAAAATIVSGAVAERCQLAAYLIYTCFITGFIYPVVVHWVWDSNGWLSAWNSKPVGGPILPCIDFAGSGVVRSPHPFFPSRRRPFF